MGRIVGIDLGTTNSVIAVLEGGEPTVIPLADGSRLCPSVVGFSKSGERLVGQLAKRQAIKHPDRTIASIKRHMGDPEYRVAIDDRFLTPQEISAMILQKLKTDAEAYLGEPVDRAVITVPAYFSDSERQATKDAGRIAGLEVTRIINEPTAAALAYGMDKADVHTVLVWDLGGGTFDVSILEVGDGVFEVKATNGDTHLGGDDWDERIVVWIAEAFERHAGVDLRSDKVALQRLREAAEKAKIELSSVVTTAINLPFVGTNAEGPVHLEMDLTRAQIEALTDDLRDKMLEPTRNALADCKLNPSEIDVVLLVGGSTRMPAVQQMVREMFGKEPHKGTNPDEVVALGAAVEAGILGGEIRDLILLDVTPLSLGIETVGGVATRLIARNTTIPTSVSQTFTTAADGQTAVDIHIIQGEREFAGENRSLGRFQLRDIAPIQRGLPKIEVTFDIDANGIVNVSARDKATGREQRVTLTSDAGLSKSDIEQMVRDAASHATEDSNRRDLQDARNAAESRLHSGEKTIADAKGRVDATLIDAAQTAAAVLREALAATDASAIRQLGEVYTDSIFAISTVLYSRDVYTKATSGPGDPVNGAGKAPATPEHEIPLEFTTSVLGEGARSASFEADPSVATVNG